MKNEAKKFSQILKYYHRKFEQFAARFNWVYRRDQDMDTAETLHRRDTTFTVVDSNGVIPGIFFFHTM